MTITTTSGQATYPPTISPPKNSLNFPNNIIKLLGNNLELIPQQSYHDFVVISRGPPRMVFVTGPDYIKEMLQDCWDNYPRGKLKNEVLRPLFGNSMGQSEQSDWKWQRRAVAPLFRYKELLRYGPVVQKAAADTIVNWRNAARGESRLMNKDMFHAAYFVISNTLLTGVPDDFLRDIEKGHDDYFASMNWWIAYTMLGLPGWLPRPGGKSMHAHEKKIRDGVLEIVRSRRHTAAEKNDMLAKWLSASDPQTGRKLTDELARDNVVSFLVSGYETVALTLTWALYLLTQNRYWESEIVSEVNRVAGNGPVTSEHVKDLKIVQQVIDETLRLYPPTPFIVRDVVADGQFDNKKIHRGAIAFIPVYAVHRHRKLWDDPDRFDPSRFSGGSTAATRAYKFLPFGAGPRVCIGSAFAMIETTMLLAEFVRTASFSIAENFIPVPVGRSVLVPGQGMPMKVTLRDDI